MHSRVFQRVWRVQIQGKRERHTDRVSRCERQRHTDRVSRGERERHTDRVSGSQRETEGERDIEIVGVGS